MDLTTVGGLGIGVGLVLVGFLLEGGRVPALLAPTSFLIVFGGTVGAMVVGMTMGELKLLPKMIIATFRKAQGEDPLRLARSLVQMAGKSRREGLLALQEDADRATVPILKRGLTMVIDGADPDTVHEVLQMELSLAQERWKRFAKLLEGAAAYSPTMGIIGTVLAMIEVMAHLAEDPAALGPKIAVAFTATLYGLFFANFWWLPLAEKLKTRGREEGQVWEMLAEGILAVQGGENARVIQEKLEARLGRPLPEEGAAVGGTAPAESTGSD